ncbi:hypothetical protein Y032_0006g2810 [Ancylostoma ceylanicum]|uniref:G-protein coupled receptors family 1 profile domain-containing protein n=1 Tax=Ancylostoma ceylanicum TaxID=53326 RepID=A0A016VP15_9BILA|nr:hypothetical protein Y032_0006g2810 [Ancylostoma ceylanicum]
MKDKKPKMLEDPPSRSTSDHLLQHDTCVYWQLLPLFGVFFSAMMLLNVAVDRLLSLTSIYIFLVNQHKLLYIGVQTGIATGFALFMVIWTFVERKTDQRVVCAITAPMEGHVYDAFSVSIMTINILIIVCYVLFLLLLKKRRINNDTMKNIYRSLIIISLTTIFGWFSTMLIVAAGQIMRIEFNRIYVNLLAGLFVNFACATTFFVYYGVSSEYRKVFDQYLHLKGLKTAIGIKMESSTAYNGPSVAPTTAKSKQPVTLGE